jgi:cephalosporin hydroxylase
MFDGYFAWRDRMQSPVLSAKDETADVSSNRLQAFFKAHHTGHGIYKWEHYFEIYDRYLQSFRGRDIVIVEIGIYSGGSLEMWRDYFGDKCRIVGVDIEPACKSYESDSVRVFIGDQADREFWRRFQEEVGPVDIVIDDGGHTPQQQIVTLEEMLPYLNPGGVYIAEDIHGEFNGFTSYLQGLEQQLSAAGLVINPDVKERALTSRATPLQDAIEAIHHYPFITVIERRKSPVGEFIAPKMGTQWQPFLD